MDARAGESPEDDAGDARARDVADVDTMPDGGVWVPETLTLEAVMTSPDPHERGYFGKAVALTSDGLFVAETAGAEGIDGVDGHVYRFDVASQALTRTLAAPSDAGGRPYFGRALGVVGDALYVGAPGAYARGAVFRYDLRDAQDTPDEVFTPGVRGAEQLTFSPELRGLGRDLHAGDDALVVGSDSGHILHIDLAERARVTHDVFLADPVFATDVALFAGAVWTTRWTHAAVEGMPGGVSRCTPGDALVCTHALLAGIGAVDAPAIGSGAAWLAVAGSTVDGPGFAISIFSPNDLDAPAQTLEGPDELTDAFATDVSVGERMIAIGGGAADANAIDDGAGAVFIYQLGDDDVWRETQRLISPNARYREEFGYAVAISETHLAVGARFDDTAAPSGGAVYLYRRE